ncbi:hypothetical protein B0H16DRAFT_1498347 [Mycena metata]|uniref:DUF6593 domain-containing protein n=1 Tax=Mycena metata TaxID=1033252 RepID=A0AAD7KA67_9AGAR|nr:hypothetical protein B0H16DRAFT_1498347 [Mycena metata]
MDTILRFAFSKPDEIRTFRVHKRLEDGELALYEFYHSSYGPSSGVTTFQRKNLSHIQISWTSRENATVHFGISEVNIRDLRKPKKSSSQSRRFKAGGSEYKWKMTEGSDLLCVDSRGKTRRRTLSVGAQVEHILDRVVVTCLLNLWIRQLGLW